MENFELFDAEYKFMDILWEYEPINSTQLTRICFDKLGWKKSTAFSMIKRLSERNIVKNEKATVTAIIKREQVRKHEADTLLNKAFGGSIPTFITSFLKDRTLSEKEALEIKKIIDEATKKR